ncbi:hypothetical protein BaRGS_00010429 [Batillaria attramentaria]|uniref:Uncharacterized protein n=1 Tax=Batillaria attramentaria TaxID=370345 RepID=A0ABD0LFE7_9CAEN
MFCIHAENATCEYLICSKQAPDVETEDLQVSGRLALSRSAVCVSLKRHLRQVVIRQRRQLPFPESDESATNNILQAKTATSFVNKTQAGKANVAPTGKAQHYPSQTHFFQRIINVSGKHGDPLSRNQMLTCIRRLSCRLRLLCHRSSRS